MDGEYIGKRSSGIRILTLLVLLVLVMSGCARKSEERNGILKDTSTQADENISAPEPSGTPLPEKTETLSQKSLVALSPEVKISEDSDFEEATTSEPLIVPASVDEMKSYFGEFQIDSFETVDEYIDVYRKLADDVIQFIKPETGKKYKLSSYEDVRNKEKQDYGSHGWVYYLLDMDKDDKPEFGMWNCEYTFYIFKYEDEADIIELYQETQGSFSDEQWDTLILYTEEKGYSYSELFEKEVPCGECYWILQRFFKDREAIETERMSLTCEGLEYLTDIGYNYLGYEVKENGNVIVEFAMYEAVNDRSAVLELAPAENENGYIIESYMWLDTQR